MTWLFDTMLSVVPSGADLTSADVPDDAAGAGLVLDDDRRTERLRERRLRGARDRVDAGRRGDGQDELDRPVALRSRAAGDEGRDEREAENADARRLAKAMR